MFADLYAHALYRAARKATPEEQEHLLKRLKGRLSAHGHEKLLPKIYEAYRRLLERQERRSGAVLSIARADDEEQARKEAAASSLGFNNEEVAIRIDPTLIGGWRFTKGAKCYDASHKRSLIELYRKITA